MADLITVDEYKTAYNVEGTNKDAETSVAITVASAAILDEVERELIAPTPATATRRFEFSERGEHGEWVIDLNPSDARAVTAVVLHPETTSPVTLTTGLWRLQPLNPRYGVYTTIELAKTISPMSSTMVNFGRALVDVTGTWGFPQVPDVARRACIETVRAWIRNDPGNWSQGGDDPRPEGGFLPGTRAIPPTAMRLLDSLRRYSGIT